MRHREGSATGLRIDENNPYPGLHPFEEQDREYFFGRDRETASLLRLVRRRALTTCFGRSGLGKTSLLKAGLLPELRTRFYFPVVTRLSFTAQGELSDHILAQVHAAAAEHDVECPEPVVGETLWEYFHRASFWDDATQLVEPVLLIDQFEEAFTLGASDPRVPRLLEQLGDVIENRTPRSVKDRLATSDDDLPYSVSRQDYKVVLILREDFLPHLEDVRHDIPSLMENRFRLTAMTAEQGRAAIQGPWLQHRREHVVTTEVADAILQNVAGSDRRQRRGSASTDLEEVAIEPALLSLFCRELNERRGDRPITTDLVARAGNVFADFYERCLRGKPPALRTLIEDELLSDAGYRSTEVLEDLISQPGISDEDVQELVDQRLLRVEDRLGIPHVELIHDRLTGVVRRSRDLRRERELATARARRQRTLVRRIVGTAMVLGAAALLFGYYQYTRAEEARALTSEADQQRELAERARLAADTAEARAKALTVTLDSIVDELVEVSGAALSIDLVDRIRQVETEQEEVSATVTERELMPPREEVERGDQGTEVGRVQEWLILNDCRIPVDRMYAGRSAACVSELQDRNGLPVTGRVDEQTFALLTEPLRRAIRPFARSGETFATMLVKYAEQHADQGPREVGLDSGPWVRMYMDGYDGRPWGAGFLSYLMSETARNLGAPSPLPSTIDFDVLGKSAAGRFDGLGGRALFTDGDLGNYLPEPGDLALRRGGSGIWGGGGVIVDVFPDSSFVLVEGDVALGNQPGGVMRLTQSFDGYDFVNLTGFEKHVLWVDDDPRSNASVRTSLLDLGIAVTTATSTEDAMVKLGRGRFDAIISDMNRPEGRGAGYALLENLREPSGEIPLPFVVYSVSSRIEQRNAEVRDRGGAGQVATPRDLERLLVEIFMGPR